MAEKDGVIGLHNARLPCGELVVPLIPKCHGVSQNVKNILQARPRITILEPALLNNPPQFVAKSKSSRLLRFPGSNPFHDCMDG